MTGRVGGVQWAVLADDLTGALDTGIQFARRGASVRVVVDGSSGILPAMDGGAVDVWVVNTRTRHCAPAEAYRRVAGWARGFEGIARRFYLKTDSTLRGNPGAELAALLDGLGADLACFAPAYPDTGRTTRCGVQYLYDVPIHETELARDPENPISCSDVASILRRGYDGPVHWLRAGERLPESAAGVWVFDARTNADLGRIADGLRDRTDARIYAGCAGFARAVPLCGADVLGPGIAGAGVGCDVRLSPPFLIFSGSVHARTLAQIRRAGDSGVACVRLDPRALCGGPVDGAVSMCREALARGQSVILATALSDADRIDLRGDRSTGSIQEALARCWLALPEGPPRMVIGGDALQVVMKAVGEAVVEPIAEPLPGMVLSRIGGGWILTRSGGFGQEEDLARLCAEGMDVRGESSRDRA